MNTKYLPIHKCPQGQIVKRLIEIFPRSRAAVLLNNLIIESINSGNLPRLMIPPEQQYILRVLHLIAEQQFDSFHRVIPAIHEITNEDVPVLWEFSSDLEELEDIEELPVYVSADCDGCLGLLHVGLLEEQLLHSVAECPH